jgi:hypothetical protein
MVLATGLTLIAIAVALVLSGSPVRVVAKNSVAAQAGSVAAQTGIASADGHAHACQADEVLPSSTSALRLSFEAAVGPSVTVTALSGTRVLTRGTRASGWTGAQVTVPVVRVPRTTSHVTVCFGLGQSREVVHIFGRPSRTAAVASSGADQIRGRFGVEYLAAGRHSWWSLVPSVARRIGLGRAPGGTWIVLVLAALMAAVAILASGLCIQTLATRPRRGGRTDRTPTGRPSGFTAAIRRVPAAAWVCALVACINALCWSILSPPFQVPEEPAHFAYVQQLAETGQLPAGSAEEYSPEEEVTLEDLHHQYIQFVPSQGTISSVVQEQRLERDLAQPLSRTGPGDAGRAASEPPLYYALETIPYELGSAGTLLDQLELMRVLSALFGGLAALFAFLFVRETLPRDPWAWTVGGLGVSLAPLLGFMSGAVNPDALLFAVAAALFYLLARAFRRGLTLKLAAVIGSVTAVGFLTKLNFLGLAPGVILGVIVTALRTSSKSRRAGAMAITLAIAASPALLYIAFKSSASLASLDFVSGAASNATQSGSVLREVSYIWQLYLPRLPGMTSYFPGLSTTRQLWFDGLVGMYGWADTLFPGWVYGVALVPAALLACLCLRALVAGQAVMRSRKAELCVYAIMTVGVLTLVGIGSYANGSNGPFWEPRYLLPMIPLAGAGLALAARGAGRRWGPVSGAMIVVLILAHDLFSQLLVVSRYYS